MLLKKHPVSSIAALSALLFAQGALAADTLTDALTGGKASANLQYRYEDVRTGAAASNTATAHTVRLRLGYETAAFNGFGAMVEAESVKDLGNKKYDSKATGQTANGYAVIADPEATEINQAYLSYSGIANTTVKLGRQRIKLDNDRFIGNVGWRQNEQTFDAFTLVNKSLPSTTITVGYITNVNRIFSDNAAADNGAVPTAANAGFSGNHRMQSTILNASYTGWSFASITGYGYLLDYDVATAFTANSSDTYGLRLNGSTAMGGNKLLYTAEFAEQRSAHGNATNYKTSYTLLEAGVDMTNIAVIKLGYEVLGSDTGAANTQFKTPLATLHAFNGWADLFLTTPQQGLKDGYVSARTKLAGIVLGADYHDYRTDVTTAALTRTNLGKEWDLLVSKTFDKNYTLGLKYADYRAGTNNAGANGVTAFVNTQKTWLWGEFKF